MNNKVKKYKPPKFGAELSTNSMPFSVRATQEVSTKYIVDIWDELENLSDIEELLYVLGIAKEEDQVVIHLSCRGGDTSVGDAVMLAMNNCRADIHIEASGVIASFATFILLNCDSFEISPFAQILCHSAYYSSGGKMADMKQYSDFTYDQCEKMIRYYYEGFLTEEEIDRIITQKYEHWMTSEEFVKRFQKMVEYRENKAKAFMEEQNEETTNVCSCPSCDCDEQD